MKILIWGWPWKVLLLLLDLSFSPFLFWSWVSSLATKLRALESFASFDFLQFFVGAGLHNTG
jgi:hypothetical protein